MHKLKMDKCHLAKWTLFALILYYWLELFTSILLKRILDSVTLLLRSRVNLILSRVVYEDIWSCDQYMAYIEVVLNTLYIFKI